MICFLAVAVLCFAAVTVGPPPNATIAPGVACADFGIRAKVRESDLRR